MFVKKKIQKVDDKRDERSLFRPRRCEIQHIRAKGDRSRAVQDDTMHVGRRPEIGRRREPRDRSAMHSQIKMHSQLTLPVSELRREDRPLLDGENGVGRRRRRIAARAQGPALSDVTQSHKYVTCM